MADYAYLDFDSSLAGLLVRPRSQSWTQSRPGQYPNIESTVSYPVRRRASIKDVLESLGVPHTEVAAILASDGPRDFSHILRPGERLDILGADPDTGPPLDPTRESPLREPLDAVRFLADVNVHRLAELLRMAGFDAASAKDNGSSGRDDAALARRAAREGRILLTRDRALLKRSLVEHGRLVRNHDPWEQLVEIVRLYGLTGCLAPFTRCIRCNGVLQAVDKAEVLDRLEPKTKRYYEEFSLCTACGQVYWPGSHFQRMHEHLARAGLIIIGEAARNAGSP